VKVLLLNQYFHPDLAPTAQLSSDLAVSLAARGHEVRAIASARPYAGNGWRPLVEEHRGVRIARVPATALGRAGRAARLVDYASFLGAAGLPLIAGPRPDVVIALSTPPLVAALGLATRRLCGARLIYWVMDVYPEVALKLGAIHPGTAAARASAALARTLYQRADAIVALDDAMRARLIAAGAPPERVHVIDNWAPDSLTPLPRVNHPLRRRLGLGDRFTIGYSGNMGLGHDFATLGEAMRLLADDDFHWLFVGDGPRRRELEERARASGAPHVIFLDYLPPKELPLGLTAADAHLITLEPGLAGLLAPSKLYGVLAAGRPVVWVGPDEGRVPELVREHRVGVAAANGDGAALADGLRRLREYPAAREEMGRRARALHESRFARASALAHHVDLVERMCSH
jgi:glycosyltransferase involved in cell wall biosynthesis